jgi:hypothetical protein
LPAFHRFTAIRRRRIPPFDPVFEQGMRAYAEVKPACRNALRDHADLAASLAYGVVG